MSLFFSSDNEIEVFENCYKNQLPLLIKGPTGCGKSQLVQYMSEKLNRPLIIVSCNEDTNNADLLGRFLIKGAETVWQDGPITRAARVGAILYLDEIAEARADVVVAIHPLTDHRREVYLDKINEVVKAHANFMCVASFNPGYQRGFKELKPSTRQRFVNLSMSYLKPEDEAQVLMQISKLPLKECQKLVKLAQKIRNMNDLNLKETISTRLLVYAAQLIQSGMNPRKACTVSIAETLSDDADIVSAIKDLIHFESLMDLLEKLYEVVSRHRENNRIKKINRKKKECQVFLPDIKKSLKLIVESMDSENKFKIRDLQASDYFVGVHDQVLYLPYEISVHSEAYENRKIYIRLVLQSVASVSLNLFNQNGQYEKINDLDSEKINRFLDEHFINYQTDFNQFQIAEAIFYSSIFKPVRTGKILIDPDNHKKSQDKKNNKVTTEIEKIKSGPTELEDFSKEKVNPIMHSFEKMNTTDDYEGGRRIDSGEDELEEHAKTLSDLKMNKITRQGESVQSVFSLQNFFGGFGVDGQNRALNTEKIQYHEWNHHRQSYTENFCTVIEKEIEIKKEMNSDEYNECLRVKLKYKNEIRRWQRQIQTIVMLPLLQHRLKEGNDIDIDAVIHDFPYILKKQNTDERWYSNKIKSELDLSVLVLFDQSMSTDSWVGHDRIIDIIKDSISQIGILFEGSIDRIQIAGTWSETRSNCSFQYYKKFNESWNQYYEKSNAMEPQGYTRLGPALRHGAKLLSLEKADRKVLILLTDGKPTDIDGYEGQYGVYDIRKACIEAENQGVSVFALTIDKQAKNFFPKMFKHYKVLKTASQLSEEIFNLLLRLYRKD